MPIKRVLIREGKRAVIKLVKFKRVKTVKGKYIKQRRRKRRH